MKEFIDSKPCDEQPLPYSSKGSPIRVVVWPFKDQHSTDIVGEQFIQTLDLSQKTRKTIQPVSVTCSVEIFADFPSIREN